MDLDISDKSDLPITRINLNANADMVVVGRNSQIISDTDKIADVRPFTSDYESMH